MKAKIWFKNEEDEQIRTLKKLEAKMKALEQSAACSGKKTLFDMLSRSSSISKTTLAATEQIHTLHDWHNNRDQQWDYCY